jgi:predicted amidohydrolase
MKRMIRIAAVQLPNFSVGETNGERRENNFHNAEYWLDQAGQRGAGIACIGEHYNSIGLDLTPENFHTEIEGATEEAVDRLSKIAKRHHMYVIAPVWGKFRGTLHNAALVLDRKGEHIGTYHKVHLTRMERSFGLVPGDLWPTFELDFGVIGIQICHDNSFPESARCLTLNGAEIIFWPYVMSGWGGEFMDILLRSPAIHNGIHHVPVCFGSDSSHAWRPGMMIGRSSIIAPDGTIMADAGRYPGLVIAQVDLDAPRIANDFTRQGDRVFRSEMLTDRRPEIYHPIIRSLASAISSKKQDDIISDY